MVLKRRRKPKEKVRDDLDQSDPAPLLESAPPAYLDDYTKAEPGLEIKLGPPKPEPKPRSKHRAPRPKKESPRNPSPKESPEPSVSKENSPPATQPGDPQPTPATAEPATKPKRRRRSYQKKERSKEPKESKEPSVPSTDTEQQSSPTGSTSGETTAPKSRSARKRPQRKERARLKELAEPKEPKEPKDPQVAASTDTDQQSPSEQPAGEAPVTKKKAKRSRKRKKKASEAKMEPVAECQIEIRAQRSWQIRAIIGRELLDDVPLEDAYCSNVKNKQDISKAMRSISAALPGFSYLKRCNGIKLLLARTRRVPDQKNIYPAAKDEPEELLPEEELREMLVTKGFDMSLIEDTFEVVRIPCKPPKTKDQAKRVGEIWPLNFHPDAFIEDIIMGTIFDDRQLDCVEEYVKVLMEAAKMGAVGTQDCCGSSMIVDPKSGQVLSLAVARVDRHPMWHCTMLAVDLVARLQGEGAWYLSESEEAPADVEYIKPNDPSVDQDEVNSSSNGLWKIGRVAKRKYKEGDTLFYPESLSKIKLPEPTELDIKKKKKKSKKIVVKEDDSDETSSKKMGGPYLCTGYWAFLLQEPCSLCAMALLHSRVAKIFYGAPNTKAGVLGSRAVLHALPGLNHRYQVWSGIFEKECVEILQGLARVD